MRNRPELRRFVEAKRFGFPLEGLFRRAAGTDQLTQGCAVGYQRLPVQGKLLACWLSTPLLFASHGCGAPTVGRGLGSEMAVLMRPKVGVTRELAWIGSGGLRRPAIDWRCVAARALGFQVVCSW